ncbi:Lactoylglutathione lyase [Methylobacterium cerastii]|uniref:Lactoylglutathione lyase n=1 Tax=Methylobacterium cerastii TaxID=932741 RepID=A0ABQ4QH01_9HYPH|nr:MULTISPECIES: VOC family protein [Methylobacterium]TXM88492.1 VOC family protein [Methylobacterium sp. WL122]TXM68491.1 VOC family protein [Methylobacterium sp. WL120]TXM74298.1 VOC family protein [Methylobacterium sp. WL12]TXM88683.1 VOC family protein [Methylobacterium sp. WL103]TXN82474.1 VOC family protein [Methylobacterium sp. WL8]
MDFHIDHVHLRSRDAAAAAAFYVDTLAAREIRREGTPLSRVVLDLGGLRVFIEQAPADLAPPATAPHLGIEHIGLGVADIDATMADLRARGVTVLVETTVMRPGLRVAFIDGPDGVRIEILERRDV